MLPTAWRSSLAREPPITRQDRVRQHLHPGGTLIKFTGQDVLVRREGFVEEFALDPADRFGRVILSEVGMILGHSA